MRAVEHAAILIVEGAFEELEDNAPMRGVRHADQHDATRAEKRRMLPHEAPGIAQMLQHVAVDDAVVAAGHLERQRIVLDIEAGGLREARGRHLHGGEVVIHAEDTGVRVPQSVNGPQHPLVAADIEHDLGIEGDPVEQVRIQDVRIVGRLSRAVRQGQIQSSLSAEVPARPDGLIPRPVLCCSA
jgi:hypothetical protein